MGELQMIGETTIGSGHLVPKDHGESPAQPEWQSQNIFGLGLTPQSADARLELFDLQPVGQSDPCYKECYGQLQMLCLFGQSVHVYPASAQHTKQQKHTKSWNPKFRTL